MRARRLTLAAVIAFVILALAGAGCEEEGLHCCMIRQYCSHCGCDAEADRIRDSGNETACEEYVDSHTLGCWSADYYEDDALADCS